MRLIEAFLEGKDGESLLCEDAIFVGDSFAAVFDGATDKTDVLYDGVPGGRFAADALVRAMEGMEPEISSNECVATLTIALADAILESGPSRQPRDEPSASAVIYSAVRSEIWRVGDCSWSVNGQPSLGRKLIDEIVANARAALLNALLIGGSTLDELRSSDPGREMTMPLLEEQYRFRNVANPGQILGFGALDRTPVPARFIEVTSVGPHCDVVLASDGYPRLLPTLADTEEALAQDLAHDPLRIGQFKATKAVAVGQISFDDRAYVRLRS